MKLPFGERLRIQRMANGHNVDWERISKQVGASVHEVKDAVDAYYSPKFKRMLPKPKHSKIPKMDGQWGRRAAGLSAEDHQRVRVPADVLADRDHRGELDSPSFGDPKPGYSMLDRRKQ